MLKKQPLSAHFGVIMDAVVQFGNPYLDNEMRDKETIKKGRRHLLFGVGGNGETDSHVIVIKDGVELSNEDISEDPERSCGGRDVHSHESRDALRDTTVGDLEHVVFTLKGEVLSSEVEGDVGKILDLSALNHELTSLANFASTNSMTNLVDDLGRSSEKGCAGVNDGRDGALGIRDASNLHLTKVNSPVVLGSKRLPRDLTNIVGGVGSTESHLSSGLFVVESTREIAVEPESEDGLGAVFLVGPDLVHGLRESINGDGIPSHSQDTVELCGDESESGLGHGTRESLGRVGAVSRVFASEADFVVDDVSSHGSGSVLDLEGNGGLGAGGRLGAVVLVVSKAGDVGVGASLARHPQIGRSSVEESLKLLSGGSDGDLTVVLSLGEVGETLLVDVVAHFVSLDVLLLKELSDGLGLVSRSLQIDLLHRHSVECFSGDDRQKADDEGPHDSK
ncbi:hypothetical protein PFISCL1PPCAC_28257, partial [Pristionchus fissidentatus]